MLLKSDWNWQKKARKLEDRSAEVTQFEEQKLQKKTLKMN